MCTLLTAAENRTEHNCKQKGRERHDLLQILQVLLLLKLRRRFLVHPPSSPKFRPRCKQKLLVRVQPIRRFGHAMLCASHYWSVFYLHVHSSNPGNNPDLFLRIPMFLKIYHYKIKVETNERIFPPYPRIHGQNGRQRGFQSNLEKSLHSFESDMSISVRVAGLRTCSLFPAVTLQDCYGAGCHSHSICSFIFHARVALCLQGLLPRSGPGQLYLLRRKA